MLHAALVHVHLAQFCRVGDAVPDEIESALAGAQVVVESGDWVGDHLLARWQVEREQWIDRVERVRCEVGFVRRAAPDVVAGIDRLHVWSHLPAHTRPNSVAADENIRMLDALAGKLHAHSALILVDPCEIPSEMITGLVDGLPQEPLQAIPGCEDLPQRPLVGDAAFAVDRDALGYLDTKILGAGSARFQGFHELRVAGDAGAAADQLDGRPLIDVHVPPYLPQERRRKEPGHRAANDDGPSLGATGRG